MSNIHKQQNNTGIYIRYIIPSCLLTAFLNTIHSYIIDISIKSTSFIIPVIAGLFFGYLLAKNKLLSQHLKTLAHTDMLTGVYNRMMFEHMLEAEILKTNRYGGTFSLIFLDIDHFKQVNDQFGHPVGDVVLSDFSHLIKKANRLSDLTARYGGEEFVILSISSNLSDTVKHAERLRRAIEMHSFDTANKITCSFGVAEFKKELDTKESLLKRADDALYEAKQNGRNRVETKD